MLKLLLEIVKYCASPDFKREEPASTITLAAGNSANQSPSMLCEGSPFFEVILKFLKLGTEEIFPVAKLTSRNRVSFTRIEASA